MGESEDKNVVSLEGTPSHVHTHVYTQPLPPPPFPQLRWACKVALLNSGSSPALCTCGSLFLHGRVKDGNLVWWSGCSVHWRMNWGTDHTGQPKSVKGGKEGAHTVSSTTLLLTLTGLHEIHYRLKSFVCFVSTRRNVSCWLKDRNLLIQDVVFSGTSSKMG